jgi:hypothetical protein
MPASAPTPGRVGPDEIDPGADEADDAVAAAESLADELADWKEALRSDFEEWLASLDEIPEPAALPEDAAGDVPDLYAFYEQWAAASAESRKANRRVAEAIAQWGETLARFDSSLAPLRETTAQLAAAQPKEGQLSRAHCLMLVELLDRMRRLAAAFRSPPAARRSWWSGKAADAWPKAWEAQHQALDILVSHLEGLLKKEGVTPIDTCGEPFDPQVMVAIATAPDPLRPAGTVLEELAAGYRRHGELLRAAQVKVTRRP